MESGDWSVGALVRWWEGSTMWTGKVVEIRADVYAVIATRGPVYGKTKIVNVEQLEVIEHP